MNKLKPILDFFLYSNIFVAFAIACLTFQTYIILNAEINFSLLLFVFSSCLFAYSFHRSFGLKRIPKDALLPPYLDWIRSHKKQMVLIFTLSFPFLLFCSFQLSVEHLISLFPLGLISLLYSIPVIPGSRTSIGLNKIQGLKIFLISFLVSYISIIIPAISVKQGLLIADNEMLLLFAERFLFVFALAIPFDIRDIERDKANQVKTIPVIFGEQKAKMIAFAIFVLCAILYVFHYNTGGIGKETMIPIIISLLISAIMIFLFISQKD